jgi:hypothetical protein
MGLLAMDLKGDFTATTAGSKAKKPESAPEKQVVN